ncbi:MAG: HK97-gp10 family putative phage morphogenesis protein [Acidovorax temperans]|uniref:HK97-gp10 family putative phage morphogenesis protein n=1 Tax=Acidovorax temperans TaxID=80878 RepID=UPI00391C270C
MADKDILGIGDMKANFAKLRDEVRNRTSRRMVVAGGNVLKRKAKQIAQANGSVRTGAMVKNIAIKREAQAGDGTTQYHLGVRHGRNLTAKAKKNSKLAVASTGRIVKRYADDPYYWRFVEFGHNVVSRKTGETGNTEITYTRKSRSGKVFTYTRKRSNDSLRARRTSATGTVAAKPFIGPALEQGRAEALEVMNDRLQADLAKAGKP